MDTAMEINISGGFMNNQIQSHRRIFVAITYIVIVLIFGMDQQILAQDKQPKRTLSTDDFDQPNKTNVSTTLESPTAKGSTITIDLKPKFEIDVRDGKRYANGIHIGQYKNGNQRITLERHPESKFKHFGVFSLFFSNYEITRSEDENTVLFFLTFDQIIEIEKLFNKRSGKSINQLKIENKTIKVSFSDIGGLRTLELHDGETNKECSFILNSTDTDNLMKLFEAGITYKPESK
jgi:hypothetical protein